MGLNGHCQGPRKVGWLKFFTWKLYWLRTDMILSPLPGLLFVPVSIWTWLTSSPVDVPVSLLRFYNLSKASLPQLSGWAESKKDWQASKLTEGFPFNVPTITIWKIKLLSDNCKCTGSWKNYCRDSLCSLPTFPQW